MEHRLKKLNTEASVKEHREEFLRLCRNYESLDINKIEKAFYYCYFFHRNDKRKDGTRYYLHPLHSAYYLLDIFKFDDTNSIIASLLHDSIEEPKEEKIKQYRRHKILEVFGEDILELVQQVTKIKSKEIRKSKEYEESETFRTLTLAMIKDIRVILIKLSDRLHNLSTLSGHDIDKRKEIADETLKFFVPIAQWLGIRNVKQYIEEICFENLDFDTYQKIKNYREEQRVKFTGYIQHLENNLHSKLEKHNIKNIITTEHKTNYEIYDLAIRNKIDYDKVDNSYSMVITILKDENDSNDDPFIKCYTAFGVLNKYFTVIEERDYIRNPKFNNFQSIITYIYNENGKIVEILIRTEEMDSIATNGTINEIKKNKRYRTLNLSDNEIELLGEYIDNLISQKVEDATKDIWELMGINYYRQEINVFVEGEKYKLPKDTALINLAFLVAGKKALYLDLENTTINDKKAYYNTTLMDKDIIELRFTDRITATEDWRNHLTMFSPIVQYYEYEKYKKL